MDTIKAEANAVIQKVTEKVTDALAPQTPFQQNTPSIISHDHEYLTSNTGNRIFDNHNQLKVGPRGPVLLEDQFYREKITAFDHERMPERVVHARGNAAHGYFQCYESQAAITRAHFLQDPNLKTPVFLRFSTVAGSRGSTDTPRDVRGFAVRFYTQEGNWDLVGNNIPVFFIQDSIKFPDIIHAVKPEPHNEIPQAASAHDNFWDFISLMPESTHMIMWVMSDRALPRSQSMMEGFGVHTHRLINEKNESKYVKFHWKPVLGVHSTVWDETNKISGKDPDYHRRDLWESIERGDFPEWELGFQVFDDEMAAKFDFDYLDSTKLIPEELVPVKMVGKMTLNKNTENYYAETEQVAFHLGNIVTGIDHTNDPLLQGRLFSYIDTQINRFSSSNYHQLPINRPVCPVRNHYQDGFMRMENMKGRVNYEPNSFNPQGCPYTTSFSNRAFVTYPAMEQGPKIKHRSESFNDHFSQATLFYNSMSEAEKDHMVDALRFELGKVETKYIRERMIDRLNHVDNTLAKRVAAGIGLPGPKEPVGVNHGRSSPALSQTNHIKHTAKARKIAIIIREGFDFDQVSAFQKIVTDAGAHFEVISKWLGNVKASNGKEIEAEKNFNTTVSVFYDAVFIPGGKHVDELKETGEAIFFIAESFKHCKTIALAGEAVQMLAAARIDGLTTSSSVATVDHGVVTTQGSTGDNFNQFGKLFIEGVGNHRHWDRSKLPIFNRIAV